MNTYEAEAAEAQISQTPTKLPTPPQPPHPKCENCHRRDPNEGLVVANFITCVHKNIQEIKNIEFKNVFGSRSNVVTYTFCKKYDDHLNIENNSAADNPSVV